MPILIFALALIMIWDVWDDAARISRQEPITHTKDTLEVAVFYVVASVVVYVLDQTTPWETFMVWILLPALRWNFHDVGLNLIRGLPLEYLGTAAWTDRLLRKLPGSPTLWRLFSLVLSAILVYFLQNLSHEKSLFRAPFLFETLADSLVKL